MSNHSLQKGPQDNYTAEKETSMHTLFIILFCGPLHLRRPSEIEMCPPYPHDLLERPTARSQACCNWVVQLPWCLVQAEQASLLQGCIGWGLLACLYRASSCGGYPAAQQAPSLAAFSCPYILPDQPIPGSSSGYWVTLTCDPPFGPGRAEAPALQSEAAVCVWCAWWEFWTVVAIGFHCLPHGSSSSWFAGWK